MRYFDRNRRRLTKKHFVRGTLIKSSGENEVTIENSAGLPLNSIEIAGNTTQKTYEGYNLFDINKVYGATSRIGTTVNATYGTVENGVLHAKYSLNQGAVKWLDSSFIINEVGTYELSCEVFLKDAVVTPRICWNLINASSGDTLVASGLRASSNLTKGSWVTTTLPTITIPDTMVGDTVYLMLTSEGGGGQNTDIPCYIRNVNLYVKDTLSLPYEPCVGGTYSPNPEYPQPIENVNNEGMNVVLHGENLFNQEDLLTNSNFTKAEYNGEECIKVIPEIYIHTFDLTNPISQGEMISVSFDVTHPVTEASFYVQLIYEDGTNQTIVRYSKSEAVADFVHINGSIVAKQNVISLMFSFFERFQKRPYCFKNFMLNIGEPKPYEPYFREEIAIPTSVDIKDTTVHLRMAGKGDVADKIKVDVKKACVTYIQRIGQCSITSDDINRANCNDESSLITFKCDPLRCDGVIDTEAANTVCAPMSNMFSYCVPWLPDRAMFDFYNYDIEENGVMLYTPEHTGSNVMTALSIACDKQGPILIQYPLETPIEHDITNTDFGQALLSLVVPRTQSGVLRVESALPASGLEVEYYSMEKEDKVTLEVLCVSEDGEELKRTSHSVRKDSKYQVKAPLIDGYTPINESIFGVASKEAEIIFEYKENEDATV